MVMEIGKFYFVSKCILINKKNKFLILKRTNYKNDGTENLWDILGGSVDLDEDVNLAIKREVREEIQIELNEAKVIGIDSGKGIPSGKKKLSSTQFVFVLFYSRDYDLKNGIVLSEEHSQYKWISVDEIDNYNFYLTKKRLNIIKNFLINQNRR